MAEVYNWQLGRTMSYPHEERHPKWQFAFVFNINRCIACQTCSLACKATWTFSRGQRLGDLRRLVRFYGRTPEHTFPVGEHYRGGDYGSDVNFPVPTEERANEEFSGCTNRNA